MSSILQPLFSHAAASVVMGQKTHVRRLGFDVLAFLIMAMFFAYMVWGMEKISAPISELAFTHISLSPDALPEYALRTTLRMLIAVFASLLFTLVYATLAAKSHKAGQILIPLLDILQSVPVFGYISFTVTGFIALFPSSMLGLECAAIFAIFTSQAWNMTFSLYQSLRTVPDDMEEAAYVFRLSAWQKFWRVELPFAMPGLIWNMMMSMSGGWFFVVASEAITVGNQHITLPGIGSYIALAIQQKDLGAIGCAIGTMTVVIMLYDQFLFQPLVAWSDKFSDELTASQYAPNSWVLNLFGKSRLMKRILTPIGWLLNYCASIRFFAPRETIVTIIRVSESKAFDFAWYALLACIGLTGLHTVFNFFHDHITWSEFGHVSFLASITFIRVFALIVLASLVWVPIGVAIGLRPQLTQIVQPIAQFLAAFPANLLFPIAVILISHYSLNPDIWLSPLMILGTQWYILFNVIAGASAFPNDLLEVSHNFSVKGWLWWRRVMLPGIFPYYLTGAITASGGAWNASIVSEVVSWGTQTYTAKGLGAYIAEKTVEGDFVHIALGVGMMSLLVASCNKLIWRPLYNISTKKLRVN